MDRLWTPWRMDYLRGTHQKKKKGCVFCGIKEAKLSPKNLVLAKGRHTYVVLNRYPYSTGHLMIIPYRHTALFEELPAEAYQEIVWFLGKSISILQTCLKAQGFNCGLNIGKIAGGGIPDHMHWHVVPRWAGDINFLMVLAETRAMPQLLGKTYATLAKHFKKLNTPSKQ